MYFLLISHSTAEEMMAMSCCAAKLPSTLFCGCALEKDAPGRRNALESTGRISRAHLSLEAKHPPCRLKIKVGSINLYKNTNTTHALPAWVRLLCLSGKARLAIILFSTKSHAPAARTTL